MKQGLKAILRHNREWAQSMIKDEPDYFEKLVDIQKPKYLWIGCADSRVPANEIVGLKPGELFVHRNVANVVSPADINCLAVIQYAIEKLKT
jgi:carbonic anhydrase